MPMLSIHCPVLDAHVVRVTDLEGNVTRIICAEYEAPAGTCRLRRNALSGGPLAQLLERMSENTLDSRDTSCRLRQE